MRSIFNRVTGKFMLNGRPDSPRVVRLAQNHISVEGSYGLEWKYDFNTNSVVPDTDYINQQEQQEQQDAQDRARIQDILVLLEQNHGVRQKDPETIDLLNELARISA